MKTDTTYELNLLAMRDGENDYFWHIGDSFFAGDESTGVLGADVEVRLTVRKRQESYDCDFSFDGVLQAACDRCLEAVPVEIADDYRVIVRHGEEPDTTVTGDGEELMVIAESATRLDVAPIIRDTLLLAIPMRCVHAEGECNPQMSEMLRSHKAEGEETDDQQE